MSHHRISIIGLGASDQLELPHAALRVLRESDVVIGSERQLALVEAIVGGAGKRCFPLPKLSKLRGLVESLGGQCVAVLASGDPLYYGIGRWFSREFTADVLTFYPAVSSIQVACHRLGLALQDVEVLSLHGRPLEKLRSRLRRRKQILILTDRLSQPSDLARECLAAGFADSELVVCEELGYANEQVRFFAARELLHSEEHFSPLHLTLIKVAGEGGVLPEFPGIPDTNYVTGDRPGKGMISKRETRLCILSMMQVAAHDVIWDIGAGCGSVAVELALWNDNAAVYAIEDNVARLEYLEQNRQRFGVAGNLHVLAGRAPDCLLDLPDPDKVFIGGSDGELHALLKVAWQRLPEGGVLVASAVMASTKRQLQAFASALQPPQVECVELAVKRGALSDGALIFTPRLPVEIYRFVKHRNT